jgi:CRP/FNR family cyclic AMP-dependent transcriptional regulator
MAKSNVAVDALKKLPMFQECTDKELKAIDALMTEVHVDAGRELITEGSSGLEFLIIDSGTAKVSRAGIDLAELGPGDYVGELALLDAIPRTATVTATSDMTLQVIDRRGFATLLRDTPSLSVGMLKAMARRLADVDEEIAKLRK